MPAGAADRRHEVAGPGGTKRDGHGNMTILDIPRSGRDGAYVYYMRGKKLCRRRHVIPKNVRTAGRARERGTFGAIAKAWRRVLTEAQRRAWNAAAAKVRSRPRLWQAGWLTGQTFFQGICSARSRIGREMLLLWPPEPVVFEPNPVAGLSIGEEQGRIRLKVKVVGPVVGDIMVFGAAPCSAGRKKWRNGAYLGLLPAPVGGESAITELYVARYGEPKAGERVFIRVRQQRDGWEDAAKDISNAVRAEPAVAARGRGRGGMLLGLNKLDRLQGLQRGAVAGWVGKRCTREQYRGSPIPAPWQCRTGEGCARAVRKVGPVCRVSALGEVRWSGHWRELWHGT